jgi:glycosyltransferase involved in cell wall biosynthesis
MKIACLPAFNVEGTIESVINESKKYVDKVIVCNDGSSDRTEEIARQCGAIVVNHKTNQGYGSAIRTLFEEAKKINADEMITLDSDGQHNPSEIPSLLEPIINGSADVVIGSRFLNNENTEMPEYRKRGIKLISSITKVGTKLNISDSQSGFRAYSKKAIENIRISDTGMSASTEILMKISDLGLRVKEVPIIVKYDNLDSSTQKPLIHGTSVLLSTLRYVTVNRPLTFYGLPGIAFLIIGTFFGGKFLQFYATQKIVLTDVLLVSIGTLVIGSVMVATSIILFAMSTLLNKVKQ